MNATSVAGDAFPVVPVVLLLVGLGVLVSVVVLMRWAGRDPPRRGRCIPTEFGPIRHLGCVRAPVPHDGRVPCAVPTLGLARELQLELVMIMARRFDASRHGQFAAHGRMRLAVSSALGGRTGVPLDDDRLAFEACDEERDPLGRPMGRGDTHQSLYEIDDRGTYDRIADHPGAAVSVTCHQYVGPPNPE